MLPGGMGMKAAMGASWASAAAKTVYGSGLGRRAMVGAGIGAGYGLASRDTSMLGGAVMGAGLGVGYSASRALGGFGKMYNRTSKAADMGVSLWAQAKRSGQYISNSYTRTMGQIKAL